MTEPHCQVDGCLRAVRSRKMCRRHYDLWRAEHGSNQPWLGSWTCSVDGCGKRRKCVYGRPSSRYCSMHQSRIDRHGDISVKHEPTWIDAPGYRAAHSRVANRRGRATEQRCSVCGRAAAEWAYTHCDPNELIDTSTGFPYSTNPDYYIPMCRRCHDSFDDAISPKYRGRKVCGEEHGSSKLTEQDVHEIRIAAAAGETTATLSKRYGVDRRTVVRVVRRINWTHLEDQDG